MDTNSKGTLVAIVSILGIVAPVAEKIKYIKNEHFFKYIEMVKIKR